MADMLAGVRSGDPQSRRVVVDGGRAIGRALADLCNCLNPELIIVGGQLSATGDPLLEGIRDSIDRYALPAVAESVTVKAGMLGERAEVLGAVALVIAETDRISSRELAR